MSHFTAEMHNHAFDFGWSSAPDPPRELTALLQIH